MTDGVVMNLAGHREDLGLSCKESLCALGCRELRAAAGPARGCE